MNKEIIAKIKAQFASILLTAFLGFALALAQALLESNGYACGPAPSPAVAATGGAFLKAVHWAVIGSRSAVV